MKKGNNNQSATALEEQLKGCYGGRAKPSKVKQWLVDNIMSNIGRKDKVTLNIMGAPGTAKTSIVKALSSTPVDWNGKHYEGFEVVDIPLAQIEEMGDVLGYPVEEIRMQKGEEVVWIKAVDSLIKDYMEKGYATDGQQRTIYAPPSWVPKEEKPGVLLFDDGNRASQRIVKGLMQLVQDYRTISWKIPDGWTIVFTGNPDNRFNQVTSMDTAQLTRMKFITMLPDEKEWSVWAQSNGIDQRVISFVLGYPEMMIAGTRTNPRSIAEFGRAMVRFPNLSDKEQYSGAMLEGQASLDMDTVSDMMAFFMRDAQLVIRPEDILADYKKNAKEQLEQLMSSKLKEPRLDIVSIVNDRLYAYIMSDGYKFEQSHVKNFQAWILDENLPMDCKYGLIKRLILSKSPYKRDFLVGNEKIYEIAQVGMDSMLK